MQKNSHYHPTIHEFRVGFEYEVKLIGDKEWSKTKVYDRRVGGNMIIDVQSLCDEIRVKYLDSVDIESIGFKYKKTTAGVDEYRLRRYIIEYNPISNKMLFTIDGVGDIFLGIVRNKSEFKELLTKLQVSL